MFKENKSLIVGALITAFLVIAGVFYFSKNTVPSTGQTRVKDSILISAASFKTGGIKDGKYLPVNVSPKAVLVEFGDYQCPACGAYSPLVTKLLNDYSGSINLVFRNYTLPQHANSMVAAQSAEAAGLQGKFWEMHDKIYSSQTEWSDAKDPKAIFDSYAQGFGLDMTKYDSDFNSQVVKDKIQADKNDGNLLNINATPTFFINGSKIDSLPGSYDALKNIVQSAIDQSPTPSGTPTEAFHIHFDLKVYINGKPVDFSLTKYQESKDNPLDPAIHFHDGNGKIVHVHARDISLRILFESLKINIPKGTVAYINGKKFNGDIVSYIPQDLDQILIGSDNLSSVSNDACIYSLKCPERGSPPPESCVGGLGTGCTD